MPGRIVWTVLAVAFAGCGPSRIQISGQVVGMLGLPLAGVTVGIPGHAPVVSDQNGSFRIAEVEAPYDILVKRDSPAGVGTDSAAWLGLRRADPVLVIANAAQGGARQAVVCGALTGQHTYPALTPYALPSPGGQPSPIDPGTDSFCSAVRWIGEPQTKAAIHVLGPEYAEGPRPGDFAATSFPVGGGLQVVNLNDQARLEGTQLPLAPVPASTLRVEHGGWIGSFTLFGAWAFFAPRWPGGGSPLAQSLSPPPWVPFAAPQMPDARVLLFLNSGEGMASAVRTQVVAVDAGTAILELPRQITVTEPRSLTTFGPGTRFRWAPGEPEAVYMMWLNTHDANGTGAFFQVTGSSPDLPFPDFSLVGSQPLSERSSWSVFNLGPLSGIDELVTHEHLGMALLRTDGLGEDAWFISGSAAPSP